MSLKYFGTRTNGDAGVGWMLDGLPKITRCPRIPALDGYAAPVKGDKSDQFCIDGKRLSLVSGTYAANNAEYRTMVDTFSRIRSLREVSDFHLLPIDPPANTPSIRSDVASQSGRPVSPVLLASGTRPPAGYQTTELGRPWAERA